VALDPAMARLLEFLAASAQQDWTTTPIAQTRAGILALQLGAREGDPVYDHPTTVRDLEVPGAVGPLKARYYRPEATAGDDTTPLILFFHGGGYVLFDLETHDAQARALAVHGGAAVLSVDYRLAPEDPYPAAADDCEAVARWLVEHAADFDAAPDRIAVAGDSAGGNLAAVTCLRLAASGGPRLLAQVLIYPNTSSTGDFPSIVENAEGYFLTTAQMEWFQAQYCPTGSDPADWGRSPLVAPAELLAATPPAVVCTAEYDPLRDEGEAYAERLRDAGVPVWSRRYGGLVHGFFGFGPFVPAAATAIVEVAQAFRTLAATTDATTVA
jgi:acetyl esterase